VERPDRNGTDEWNGSTSPRKEFSRPSTDNWRSREAKERERAEVKEEDDGWRTAGRGERWGAQYFFPLALLQLNLINQSNNVFLVISYKY